MIMVIRGITDSKIKKAGILSQLSLWTSASAAFAKDLN